MFNSKSKMMNKIQQLNMCQRGLLTKTQPVDLSLYFFGVFFFLKRDVGAVDFAHTDLTF